MIQIDSLRSWKVRIVEHESELPAWEGDEVFLDVETTSGDPKVEAFYPFQGHRIAGVAVLFGDQDLAYYVPVRHRHGKNIPIDVFQRWLAGLKTIKRWINHNIKFDAEFAYADGVDYDGEMVDTVVLAKIHDSDRFGHGLKPLCREWCGLPMDEVTKLNAYLKGIKSNDYGDAPIDMTGEYACMDVFGNRELYRYLQANVAEQTKLVRAMEVKYTKLLFNMEKRGVYIPQLDVRKAQLKSLQTLVFHAQRIEELTGREYTDSNDHLYDLFINQNGLPPLRFTEKGAASFDADALAEYVVHPQVTADPNLLELVKMVSEFRTEAHFKSLFLNAYQQFADADQIVHPNFNQLVRTGRGSCSEPNLQQANPRSKSFVRPRPGRAFLSADASQIEFRLIIHYIANAAAIAAYNEDPETDFHQWVADKIGIKRKQAKNINFAIGYGAGKKKVTSMIASDPDIIATIGDEVNRLIFEGKIPVNRRGVEYRARCFARAEEIYELYHATFPELKPMARYAIKIAAARGFVFNAFGRRRHLPSKGVHKAFNSVIQGCAMDVIKDRMIALDEDPWMKEHDIQIVVNVHDEILFDGPEAVIYDPATWEYIDRRLREQPIPFKVPFLWGMGISRNSWAEACGDDVVTDEAGRFVGGPVELAQAA